MIKNNRKIKIHQSRNLMNEWKNIIFILILNCSVRLCVWDYIQFFLMNKIFIRMFPCYKPKCEQELNLTRERIFKLLPNQNAKEH